jgi:hypothetical protein
VNVHNCRVAKIPETKPVKAKDWSEMLVERIGAAMKDARGSRSAKWLSDRTKELHYPISPTVIAKLDSGHRGNVLSVPELLVLAIALDIAPTALLYPGPYDRDTELLPSVPWTEIEAAEWFSGNLDRPNPVPGSNFRDYRHNMKSLRDARLLRSLEDRKRHLLAAMRDLGDGDDDRVNFRRFNDELSHIESDIERYRVEGEPE